MRERAALGPGLLARQVDAAVVARRAAAKGRIGRQVSRTEPAERRRRPVAPARPIRRGHVQVGRRLQEVLTPNHRQRRLVQHQLRHVRALRPVRPHVSCRRSQLVVHQDPQRAVTVVQHPDPVRDAVEHVAIARRLARRDHFTEGCTTGGAQQVGVCRERLAGVDSRTGGVRLDGGRGGVVERLVDRRTQAERAVRVLDQVAEVIAVGLHRVAVAPVGHEVERDDRDLRRRRGDLGSVVVKVDALPVCHQRDIVHARTRGKIRIP